MGSRRVAARGSQILLVVVFAAPGSAGVGQTPDSTAPLEQEEHNDLLQLFVETFNDVDGNYVFNIL